MTIDASLRRLLAEASPAPWRADMGRDNVIGQEEWAYASIVAQDDGDDDDFSWHVARVWKNGRSPVADAAVIEALRNNAVELLDRSDALTEALRLLREWESRTEWSARYGEKEGPFPPPELDDFLARFPQGDTA